MAKLPASQVARKFSIKCWIEFNPELPFSPKLDALFKAHQTFCKNTGIISEDTSFLMDRPKLLTFLFATDRRVFLIKMKESIFIYHEVKVFLTPLTTNDNEDDC